VNLQLTIVNRRLARLTDIYLDDQIDRGLFEEKRLALLMEQKGLADERDRIPANAQTVVDKLVRHFELLKSLSFSYKMGTKSAAPINRASSTAGSSCPTKLSGCTRTSLNSSASKSFPIRCVS
jgi:hypothetical protein